MYVAALEVDPEVEPEGDVEGPEGGGGGGGSEACCHYGTFLGVYLTICCANE